jgi:hypothetical protein
MIAGGGMQTCGILRGSRHLTCHGSFANNEVWYPQDREAQVRASQQDGVVRPQLAFLAIFQGVSGLLASSIVDTGKMVDQKMEKWEGRMVPVQLVALITNMFIGWFGPKPVDSTVQVFEILKSIQADIRKIERGIDELKAQLNRTELAVLQSWCDNRLDEYNGTYNLLDGTAYGSTTGARKAYLQLLKAQEMVLTHSIDQKSIAAYPTAELEKFRDRYLAEIKSARTKLSNSLIGANGVQTATFSACFQKDYAEWKTAVSALAGKAYPFDDRPIYDHVYQVLRGALLMQGEMLTMEQDLEMQLAYKKLVEPRADNVPAIDFNPQEHALGFCLYADERKVSNHPEYNPRWLDVASICQQNRDRIQNTYADMVRQVEFVGGAYSDEQVVLSMTAEQIGLPNGNDKNWLWMRNIPDENWAIKSTTMQGSVTGKWQDFHARNDSSPFWWRPPLDKDSDAGLYYRNEGCMNSECRESSFGKGVWHSSGEAWNDVFEFRHAVREKYGKGDESEDVVASMIALEDLTQEACERDSNNKCKSKLLGNNQYEIIKGPRPRLFTGLSHRLFWMAGSYYTYQYRSKIYFNSNKYQPGEDSAEMNCFVAEDINKNGWYITKQTSEGVKKYLKLSGKVCTSEEMAAMTVATVGGGWVNGVDCDGTHYCMGIGVGPMNSPVYKKYYSDYMGWFFGNVKWTTSSWRWRDTQWGDFAPRRASVQKGNFYHMPVVDISERKCKPKMTGGGRRDSFRVAGGVQLPSICGEDMDKLIKEIIPRPEYPAVPESVVRRPEVK